MNERDTLINYFLFWPFYAIFVFSHLQLSAARNQALFLFLLLPFLFFRLFSSAFVWSALPV